MPVGTSKIGVLGAGLVPGGSITFNTSDTWVVPPGVRTVSITGVGGAGNPGNAGNSGNAGNIGTGAGGGGGSFEARAGGCRLGFGNGGGFAGQQTPPIFFAPGGNSGNTVSAAPLGNPPNYFISNAGNAGTAGTAGSAGSAGTCGTAGNPGCASSGLCQTFPGGAGGNAGAAGNAGAGGAAGTGGGGAPAVPLGSASLAGGTAGCGAGAGGPGGGGPSRVTTVPFYCSAQKFMRGSSGGGGAGVVNPGGAGQISTPIYCANTDEARFSSIRGGPSGKGSPATPSPSPINPFGSGGRGAWSAAFPRPCNYTFPGGGPDGYCSTGQRAFVQPTPSFPTLPAAQQATYRAGGGGGSSTSWGGIPNLWCNPSNSPIVRPRTRVGSGGGGGGRGGAGGAGGCGGCGGAGSAGTPATFNCQPVDSGCSYPIVVATGGQVTISWNPQ